MTNQEDDCSIIVTRITRQNELAFFPWIVRYSFAQMRRNQSNSRVLQSAEHLHPKFVLVVIDISEF